MASLAEVERENISYRIKSAKSEHRKQNRFLGFNALFSWSFHQKSWSECKKFPVLTIKYEDLEAKTFQTFEKN